MDRGDVESIGAHCQMTFCHQLDFLPFKCESCKGTFCLDHRSESAHNCQSAGQWARRRAEEQRSGASPSPKPNILTHEQQCSEPSCKTLIHTARVTGVHCDKCRRDYCLKHRFPSDHGCANLAPLGAVPGSVKRSGAQNAKGLAALEKLRAWGAQKRQAAAQQAPKSIASRQILEATQMKKSAKGDPKIPPDKRIYLYVEASSDTVTSKVPKGTFFYSTDFTVGRVLDVAARELQVSNVNNRTDNIKDKLRVFHIEGGRLLGFNEKLGQTVQTGNTIVLLRGVNDGMAQTPDRTA
ncbi:hypothetical protein K470DRAFT_224514 [Piedraia hortae CBS 480.64]|uniref:AN1-type domain-containing protein n=1 Tax=Piedraia hortae CBS 480.64 TaxID=1314780 RepID=A0A6A7CAJ4_9PEZI|nr:hypothetical protein K470DRAFT_224514 [Piedraia hortae CBS 480.64]